MKIKLLIAFLFIAFQLFSQERINTFEIYKNDNLSYKKEDGKIFTGIAEFKKKNGHVVFEEHYVNGFLTKYILYYNLDEQIVATEIIFYKESIYKEKETNFSSKENQRKEITYFDENGKKKLNEIYKNGSLIYSCEYLNNKKHGKEFCTTKNCDNQTVYYENGKKRK